MLTKMRRTFGLYDYRSLNLIEISRKNLVENFNTLSKANPSLSIAPVLKSNAYGHGIKEVSQILETTRSPFFCVDSLFEGYKLRKLGIKKDILIMGAVDPFNIKYNPYDFIYAVFDLELAKALSQNKPGTRVHIFVDTGMHREGILINELANFLLELNKLNLKVEGLMSHLASNNPNQVKAFLEAKKVLNSFNIFPGWIHLLNSGGLLAKLKVGNLSRVGLALYELKAGLKPVLTLKTKIIQIKQIKKGERVGYNGTFRADKDLLMGLLPVGYNDGVDRRLSNKGVVTIGKTICPIIGTISMNITTINLINLNPKLGQEVTIYSNEGPNSIQNVAKICRTIPYEILIHLDPTTKRVII